MQWKFTLMEQQLKELLEWRELLQGREARSLKSMPSTTPPAPRSVSEEQSNDALVGFDINNLSDRRTSAGRTQCEDLAQYVADFMQHEEELETDPNKIPSVTGPASEGLIDIDEPNDDSTEDLNLLHNSNNPDDSKRPGIPDGATAGLRHTSFIKRQEVSKGLTRLDRPPPGVTREVLFVGDSNAQVARRFLEGTVQRGVGGTASQSSKAPENLKRRYQWNHEEQRTKHHFGFNDAHRKSHRTTAFRLLTPSRHSCRPDSRAHQYTKRPRQSFPQVRPYGNTVTDNPFPHPRDAEVRQQLPYPAVVNYTPTRGLEHQVRYVDSNIHLPPATGVPGLSPLSSIQAAHNNLAAFGWPPEMPPLHPQRQTDSSGGLPVPSSGPRTSQKTAHVVQLYTHVVPPLPLHDLRAIVTAMVNQQLDYHCQRQGV
ncbi:hypothetical protein HPB47_027701 [Ixodes persulcatus]|uniref:Uncharacterized protein n=1 Tax=Ixodes persulcatus TaxID=34615 RepID=A0AC60PWE5_IXOPE|nr:hypothetical protein HPB47_027701 [Ixodes persulcatus]